APSRWSSNRPSRPSPRWGWTAYSTCWDSATGKVSERRTRHWDERVLVPPWALLAYWPLGTSSTSSMSASAGTTSAGRWLITGFGAANPRIAIGPHGLSLALYG